MNIEIHPAGARDYPQGVELYRAAARRLRARGLTQWAYWLDPPPARVQWLREGFVRGEGYFFSADGQPAGMFRLLDTDTLYWGARGREPRRRYVHSLILRDGFAGRNLGSRVLAQIAKESRAAGVEKLRLDCVTENAGLRKYYRDQGFTEVGRVDLPHGSCTLFERELTYCG